MRTLMFAVSATMMLLFAGTACQAQPGLPPGSYGQSCRDMSMNGDQLQARCQTKSGDWRDTSLNYRDCGGGTVINDDGRLRCEGGQGYGNQGYGNQGYGDRDHDRDGDRHRGWDNGLPPGSYRETCRDMHVSGDRLDARCQKRNGGWRKTSLKNLDRCAGGIENDNGKLRCQR